MGTEMRVLDERDWLCSIFKESGRYLSQRSSIGKKERV